jgi:hypothetical protein
MYVGVYGNCLYACDSCSGILLRWKPCAASIPPGMIPTQRGAMVSHPRMVADVCAEAGWSPRRRSSWAKRRVVIEPSSAQAMGTSTASMRPAVSHGNQNLAPAVSGVFGGSGSSRYIEDGIAYVGAVGVSRGDLGAHRRGDLALCPLQCTEGLDTFVGASPRRGTGIWKEILYVAGEEWVPLRAEHFSRGDECDVMAHASNTTAVIEA